MDVEKFVEDIMGHYQDMRIYKGQFITAIKNAIAQDREERGDLLPEPCAKCEDPVTREAWKYCAGCVQEMITDPLAAKLERLAVKILHGQKVWWRWDDLSLQAGVLIDTMPKGYQHDTPLAAVDKALEEVEGKEATDA